MHNILLVVFLCSAILMLAVPVLEMIFEGRRPARQWHHALPDFRNITVEQYVRFRAFAKVADGYGISEDFYNRLPDDLKALFDSNLLTTEEYETQQEEARS